MPCGPDVEADDDRVGRRGQDDVVLGDRTDTAVDDPQRDLLADVDLDQRVLEGLDRTGHVALEDEVELVALALLHGRHEVSSVRPTAALRLLRGPLAGLALLGDLPGDPVVLDGQEGVAGAGHRGQTEHQHRTRRAGLLDVVAVLVEHRPDAAVAPTGDDRVADAQRAALDQHRRHRTATAVEVRLDAMPWASGRGWPAGPATRRR